MPVVGPIEGEWRLANLASELVKNDVTYFQELMEDLCAGTLHDEETFLPPLFDVERIGWKFSSEIEVHKMVMDVRRSVLGNLGYIAWWMAATAGRWMVGLSVEVTENSGIGFDD
jgi:hypothetical protein